MGESSAGELSVGESSGHASNRGGTSRGSSATYKNIPIPVYEMVSNEQINQVPSGSEVEGSRSKRGSHVTALRVLGL